MATAAVGIAAIRDRAGYSDLKPFQDGFTGGGEPRSVLACLQAAYGVVLAVYKCYQETLTLAPAIGTSRVELGAPTAIDILVARLPGYRHLEIRSEESLAQKYGVDWRSMTGRLRAVNLDLSVNGVPSVTLFPKPVSVESLEVEIAKSAPALTVAGSVLVGIPDHLLEAVYLLGAIYLVVADIGAARRAAQYAALSARLTSLFPALSKSIPEMAQDG